MTEVLSKTPLHPAGIVDSPCHQQLVGALQLMQKVSPRWSPDADLVEVEAEVGNTKEVMRVEK